MAAFWLGHCRSLIPPSWCCPPPRMAADSLCYAKSVVSVVRSSSLCYVQMLVSVLCSFSQCYVQSSVCLMWSLQSVLYIFVYEGASKGDAAVVPRVHPRK